MNAVAERDRERLAKLLGLLGSEHVGERAAAGAAADKHLRALGWDWRLLVERALSAPPPQLKRPSPWQPRPAPRPGATDDARVHWVLLRHRLLTPWEANFARGLSARLHEGRPLTARQRETLAEVAWRVEVRADAEFAG